MEYIRVDIAMSYITYTTIQMAMPTSKSFALWRILHDSFRVPCTLVHHQIYTHPSILSGLLTFFSSLVIQESLINFAGERLRSKTDSHCESVFYFCLSASYPVVEFGLTGLTSTSRNVRRTLHVPSVISVQWFSPERSPSQPSYFANPPPQRLSSLFSRGHRRFVEGCLLKHLLVM